MTRWASISSVSKPKKKTRRNGRWYPCLKSFFFFSYRYWSLRAFFVLPKLKGIFLVKSSRSYINFTPQPKRLNLEFSVLGFKAILTTMHFDLLNHIEFGEKLRAYISSVKVESDHQTSAIGAKLTIRLDTCKTRLNCVNVVQWLMLLWLDWKFTTLKWKRASYVMESPNHQKCRSHLEREAAYAGRYGGLRV